MDRTNDSEVQATARETVQDREARLAQRRQRDRATREQETAEQREARLASQREHTRASRAHQRQESRHVQVDANRSILSTSVMQKTVALRQLKTFRTLANSLVIYGHKRGVVSHVSKGRGQNGSHIKTLGL